VGKYSKMKRAMLRCPANLNLYSSHKTGIGKRQSLFLFWSMIARNPFPLGIYFLAIKETE
jgi:hypothetical protein